MIINDKIEYEFNPLDWINSEKLVFDFKVRELCKSCKRYNKTACCPPNIESIEYYNELLKHFNYGKFLIFNFKIEKNFDWKILGRQSSLVLHKQLLKTRQSYFNDNKIFNLIFGGGSCKICKQCKIPCIRPDLRAIPLEAIGLNLVETMKNLNVNIEFPVKDNFFRIGMIVSCI